MMSTIRRQAASCIFGLAPHIRGIIGRRFEQMTDDPEFDFDEGEFSEMDLETFRSIAKNILEMADNLPEDDPKFDGVLQIIREKQKSENNKIILFSTFRYTLYYIKRKLREAGFRVEQIDGSVKMMTGWISGLGLNSRRMTRKPLTSCFSQKSALKAWTISSVT